VKTVVKVLGKISIIGLVYFFVYVLFLFIAYLLAENIIISESVYAKIFKFLNQDIFFFQMAFAFILFFVLISYVICNHIYKSKRVS